jgi:hypothetical protein
MSPPEARASRRTPATEITLKGGGGEKKVGNLRISMKLQKFLCGVKREREKTPFVNIPRHLG